MDSSETDKATIFPNASDSVSVQDSPIFSYISNLSPIKPFKAAPVAQGFPELNSPPLVFTSPRINSQHPSSSLTRPQFPRLSSDELPQRDDDKDNNTGRAIYESGKPNTQVSSELNFCTDKGNDNNGSEHDVYEYLADPLEVDCGDSGQLANLSLKHSDDAPPSSKESAGYDKDVIAKDVKKAMGASPDILEQGKEDCQAKSLSTLKPVETDGKKRGGDMSIGLSVDHASEEQQKEHSETKNAGHGRKFESISTSQLQESMPLVQEFKYETTGVSSSEQNMMLHDSKASQPLFSMRRRCLQFGEVHQNIVANSPGSWNQSNAASDSRSPASPVDAEVLESSYANIPSAPSSTQLENMKKSVFSMFPAQNFGNSSLAVSKPSGIGLHLNSIVSVMPMGCGASASIKSAEEGYLSVQGKKSICITSCHLTENARNSSTSSNVVENLSVRTEEIKHNIHASMIASSANPSSHSLKPLHNPVLLTKPTDDHATPCDKRKFISEYAERMEEFTHSNPGKKRKKTLGSNDGDGCKRCNCKKTKCLKLYCDCFAAGIYCAEPCSCQGCFNRPEYEDTVLETRQQIESRNPLAFAPKIVQRAIELPADSTREEINHSTPSSARHKRGCNCKKSMCLKKYCECYQSNVGCSDGCRCEGCKNVYGKKEEYGFSKDNVSIEAANKRSDTTFDENLDMVATRNGSLQTEFCNPHNLTPSTPLIQCSDRGKDALKSGVPSGIFLPSTESDLAFPAPHGKPPGSPRSSDNLDTIEETSTEILDVISFDQEVYYGNSEGVDDFSTQGLGDINPFSIQQNPPSMSMTSVTPMPRVWTNGSNAQLCTRSGPFSSVNSLRWRSSSITPMVLFGETKLPWITDSENGLYNIIEDDHTPEILKENPIPITAVKVSSPNKKRVSPPHSRLHELGSSSSAGLRSGRKFILKAVPSFPPLTPCIDVKDTISRSTNDLDSSNSK